MIKQLPNALTVGNLFCGCVAIAYALFSTPIAAEHQLSLYWYVESSSFYWAALFIGFAAVCDWLDGAAARLLGVESAIGKDLDSLSDVVSFGVAPSMLLYKMLWSSCMNGTNAFDSNMLPLCPAFLVACFGAIRLARFNNAAKNNYQFTGVPIPAIGLFIAGIAIMYYHNSLGLGKVLQNKWVLYAIIAFCCWAMLSKIKLFTLKISNFAVAPNWGRYLWLGLSLACIPLLQFAAAPVSFILYIIISFFYKPQNSTHSNEQL